MSRRLAYVNLLLVALWVGAVPASAVPVTEVRVQNRGLGEVDDQSVLAHVGIREGAEFTRDAISRDVKALQKTGRFKYVGAEIEKVPGGIIVTYVVENKLRIRRLQINGADREGNRKVRDWLALGVGDTVDDASLAVAAKNVEAEYNKRYYYDAKVGWAIQEDPLSTGVDVTVSVSEGNRASVRKILFEGNPNIKARELRKPMVQKQWNPLSFLTKAGLYKPYQLSADIHAIESVYHDRGYLDVKIQEPRIVPSRKR